jgi:hypothetical protein
VKKLFLTYEGLLRVIFSSRNDTVKGFVGWATKTLFTAHLGTADQKGKLSAELLGVSMTVVKEVFNKTSSTLPVLYLMPIGKVKDLRVTLNIGDEYDDNMLVCKGGETKDLERRMDEHKTTYGKMAGSKLCLKWYNYVDPQYTKKAESELFRVLEKMGHCYAHPKYKEIIIFSKADEKDVLEQYTNISRKYIGHIKEITDKLQDCEHQNELLKKDNELLKKDHELQLMKKDMEIMRLQMQLSMTKKPKK